MLGTPVWNVLTQIIWSLKILPMSGLHLLVKAYIKTRKKAFLVSDSLLICLPVFEAESKFGFFGLQCKLKSTDSPGSSQILAPAQKSKDIQHHKLTESLGSWPFHCEGVIVGPLRLYPVLQAGKSTFNMSLISSFLGEPWLIQWFKCLMFE